MDQDTIGFIWLPSETELPSVSSILQSKLQNDFSSNGPLLALKKFLNNLFDFSIYILDFKPKITSVNSEQDYEEKTPIAMFVAEYLFNVTCMIEPEYKNSNSTLIDYYKKLITLFCSKRSDNDFPELWMNLDVSVLLEDHLSTKNYFIDLKSFSLGNIVKLNEFVEHFSSENSLGPHGYKITQVKVKFLHDEEMLYVHFFVGNPKILVKKRNVNTHRMFKIAIPYSSLHTILVCHNNTFSVYFRLYKSPMLYAIEQDEDAENCISYLDLTTDTKWLRSVDLFKDCPSCIKKEFTMNSVLCLNFHKEDYEMLKIILRHKSVSIYFSYINVVPYTPVNPSLQMSEFDCYYGFQCLLTHSHEILDHLMNKNELDIFRDFVTNKCKENSKALSYSFYTLHSAINQCNTILLNHSLKILYNKFSNKTADSFPLDKSNENILIVKRAIIIPTHIRLLPPQPILKSRALRSCNPDFSLRLSIRDVNLETINFSFQGGFSEKRKIFLQEFFYTYYKKPMLNGIKIGKRHFNYVGGSTSQLRGHGLWFYAKDEAGTTAKILRENFGNMDKIKQVPKYMARMGQTFSQSQGFIKVPQEYTNVDSPEKDIQRGVKEYLSEEDLDNKKKFLKTVVSVDSTLSEEPYTFSDGIGRISKEIAEEVYKELEIEETRPSAMQIRYAGCKGMLVVDPNLKGKRIVFRESMKKFSSENDSLEILKVSDKRTASLNRPLITILEQLGVSKEVFIKMQKEMIQNHIKSMFHEPEACDFLNRNSKLRFDFIHMHKVGICFTEDPLFRSMIYALFQKQLEFLKRKANIEIPVNKGRAMFGVLDETETLEYGEIFVQYSDWMTDERKIIEGTVVVTKNPCMHPGDVRKFKAIDVKDLHHIWDCIVFPSKGPRPHPDEMAGSDLDGDEYHVMWYEDFFFENDNTPPMHYSMPKDHTKDLERTIEPSDELDHLCDYIVNDNVGLIANAHLVFADRNKTGIFSENCIRLAKKYAIALDFAKSGRTATRHPKDRVPSYPDFMQKFGERSTYISKKALGVLYRNCKRLEMGLETSSNEIEYKLDGDLVHENWGNYRRSALKVYKKYCQKVQYLMNIYSFENEGEFLAGAIINPPKYYEQRHDLDNLMTLLEYEVQWIFNDLQKMFFAEFGGKKPKDNLYSDEMYQKASAWYIVAYRKTPGKTYNFFGFPWAVADVLIKLKAEKCRLQKNAISNRKSLLEKIIDESLSKHIPVMTEETGIQEIYENRLEILDVADKVLNKWLKTMQKHILIQDLADFKKIINSEFASVSEYLSCCDVQHIAYLKKTGNLKKATSPAYYIIETLLRLACVKTQLNKLSYYDVKQELSLLSWVTLIKLSCTYNPQYLGVIDKDGKLPPNSIFYFAQDNVVSAFRVYLFDNIEYNEEFTLKLLHEPDKVTEYLKSVSNLKHINFRYDVDRSKKFVAIFTVMGSRYAIEKLKDLVVQDDFYQWVVKDKKLFETR